MDFNELPVSVVGGLIVVIITAIIGSTQPKVRAMALEAWQVAKGNPGTSLGIAVTCCATLVILIALIITRPREPNRDLFRLSQSSHQSFESPASLQAVRIVPRPEVGQLITGNREILGKSIAFEPDEYLKENAKRLVQGAGRNKSSAVELTFGAKCASLWWDDTAPTLQTLSHLELYPSCTPLKEFTRAGITQEASLLEAIKALKGMNLRRNGQNGDLDISLTFSGRDRLITLWVRYEADFDNGPPLVLRAYSGDNSSIQKEVRHEWVRLEVAPARAETNLRLGFWFDKEPKGGGKLFIDDVIVWRD
jgi:hypothetical protein